MTVLEVLIALALLGGLSVAAAGWIELSARLSATAGPRLAWERAARALLQAIADDLAVGDRPNESPGIDSQGRVIVEGNTLLIRTRGAGWAMTRTYRYHPATSTLIVDDQSSTAEVLLGEVKGWTCEVDPDRRTLTIGLSRAEGGSRTDSDGRGTPALTRSYRLP